MSKYPITAMSKFKEDFPDMSELRIKRPVVDPNKCTGCGLCIEFCPDFAITKEDETIKIDYKACKGCGICAYECKMKAILMVKEDEKTS